MNDLTLIFLAMLLGAAIAWPIAYALGMRHGRENGKQANRKIFRLVPPRTGDDGLIKNVYEFPKR